MSARSTYAVALIERFRKRTATVGIIGLGYVGLPLALRFSEVGMRVIGFDIDASKAAAINSGRSYFIHFPSSAVASARSLSFVINTTESIVPYLRAGQLISLESTTYPGTTEEELKPRLERRGFK